MVFLAPPYEENEESEFNIINPEDFNPPLRKVFAKAAELCHNMIILLPMNVEIEEILSELCKSFKNCEYNINTCSVKIEKITFRSSSKYLVLYIGALVQNEIKLNDELDYIYSLLKDHENESFKHKRIVRRIREDYGVLNLLNFVHDSLDFEKGKSNM